jgi:membrane associated rhomboid family serine protease
MASYSDAPTFSLPRPGPALKWVLIGLLAIWLAFAIGINWAGASEQIFYVLCGNVERIAAGEIWRLFTAPLLHMPSGHVGHILTALLGLYFLAPSLESAWGSARFLRFLVFSGVIGYGLQFVLLLVLPASISGRLAGEYWFGALPVINAVSIAWALSFRGRVVRLYFVLPVSSTGLILFVLGMNIMYLIAAQNHLEGAISPFGGMLAGWLLGAGTPSPLRKAWLKLQLARLDSEARREGKARRRRAAQSGLRVIEGGSGPNQSDKRRGPDGKWLN